MGEQDATAQAGTSAAVEQAVIVHEAIRSMTSGYGVLLGQLARENALLRQQSAAHVAIAASAQKSLAEERAAHVETNRMKALVEGRLDAARRAFVGDVQITIDEWAPPGCSVANLKAAIGKLA